MTTPDANGEIKRVARDLGEAWFGVGHHDSYMLAAQIEEAILADRERSKAHWLQWHQKRVSISQQFWLRAAKSSLAGDMRELRNRVALCEAEPVVLVLSEAPNPPVSEPSL